MNNAENTAIGLVNAGIGALKAGEETLNQAVANIQKNFQEAVANAEKTFEGCKAKGAADFSDPAMKTREFVATAVRTVAGDK